METNINRNPIMNTHQNNRLGTGNCENVAVPTTISEEPRTPTTPTNIEELIEPNWLTRFNRFDRYCSGSSMHLTYRLFDVFVLLYGLFQSGRNCSWSNHLSLTAYAILCFYIIDLWIIGVNCFRNSFRRQNLTDLEQDQHLREVAAFRGFFIFLKLIPVIFGTIYSFTSNTSNSIDCEPLRSSLAIVCFSTLILAVMPPMKPSLPARRSLVADLFILSFSLLVNCTYIGTLLSAISHTNSSSCIFHESDVFYQGAPLKSYAKLGVTIYSFAIVLQILHVIINQATQTFRGGRRFYVRYFAFQYILGYLLGFAIVYYLSFGALYLFQPRSGYPCRTDASSLYRTLLVWQWLRILAPLLAIPLVLLLCCLGVVFGIIFSYCLPASITVPILELLRGWLSESPVPMNRNPPATPETIDAIPVVLFGQEHDAFNQTECAICRVDFENSEPVKKLPCDHLFHEACVKNWLLITRICPNCRQKITPNS